ncbi:Neurogenic locus notch protein 1 [Saguinus oedipus]|uniref:Neurogenic locus notch protein 1 n=1 Tax=Saguinus oedipus TaxID=9490 RepID=A0ABQ9WGD9_SAGOE|nr:Neurogenic locus notch protein 1 [Saguinus oedipus]
MIASCSGGGLETGNSEEEEDAPAVISDFIYQGASLHNQTDRTGETALHLAARYSRSDAAKRLLEASADANIQDNMGRTPLHAAVSADAQGVFQGEQHSPYPRLAPLQWQPMASRLARPCRSQGGLVCVRRAVGPPIRAYILGRRRRCVSARHPPEPLLVTQILIRNRATDLDARMHDGTTPLILAARLAVEGMLEDLINSHADVNAVDDLGKPSGAGLPQGGSDRAAALWSPTHPICFLHAGKSALHWAAAVNNVDAAVVLLKNGANKDMQNNKEETPLFLAAREGSYETAKVLLDHFANRDITDHMDRLPRDIAQERMHHDIVRLLDEYNLVRSPQLHGAPLGGTPTLSPPLCSPNGYLGSLKPGVQGKKVRKPSNKGLACSGKETKDLKVRRKKSQEGKGCLLDSSGMLSPVDSLESPHGYLSDVASPPLLPSPFQQSPSMPLTHLPGMPDTHLGIGHLNVAAKPEIAALGAGSQLAFEAGPPRLSHLPVASGTSTVLGSSSGGAVNFTVGGSTGLNGQCEWLSRLQSRLVPSQYNPLRGGMTPGPLSSQAPSLQHSMVGPLHGGLATSALPQMSYQGLPSTRLATQSHLVQTQQVQPQNLQMQPQNLQPPNIQQQQSLQPPLPPQPHLGVSSSASSHLGRSFLSGEPSQADVQPLGPSSLAAHTILPQESPALPTSLPSSLVPPVTAAQFLTPPSQHSYSSSPVDNTPSHQLQVPEHPFLTPSPESPDPWSSSSPHSNVSDWSEGVSSPPTSMQSQIARIPEAFK